MVLLASFLNFVVLSRHNFLIGYDLSSGLGFGGPDQESGKATVIDTLSPSYVGAVTPVPSLPILGWDLAVGVSEPSSNLIPRRDGLQSYKVKSGDTLSKIAAGFGVSIETIRWANPELRASLRVGEEIKILPISGILYEVKDGDSVESVAAIYKVDPNLIKQYNPSYQRIFDSAGSVAIIPYAKPQLQVEYVQRYVDSLVDLGNYFILPARGWNWGQLHPHNAVDIADSCSKPVYAAAEGLVIEESGRGFWNNGYGNYVMIEHPNGVYTRYAHTERDLVKVGDYVSQGDEIAVIGNTGQVHGVTGCHVHFEVYGAKNPFAMR